MFTRKHVIRFGAAAGLIGVSSASQAVGIDMTPLTSAVDVTTVLAAIGVVSALKFGVPFTKWAYHQVSSLFGGGK
ncbi:MAG: hypothetical protein PHG89_11655 [Gallionella sp.]|nr:hypothetical protein [Gallionella sp.]